MRTSRLRAPRRGIRLLRLLVIALLGAAWLWPGGASAQEVTLKLHTLLPMVAKPIQNFLIPWSERVAEASQGRIKVDIYPSMQLGGRPQQLVDQVRDGVVDIVWTVAGYTPGRFVKTEVFELPFVHTRAVATNLALQDFAERHGDEYKDYKVLLLHVHDGAAFHSYDPIRRVEDAAGMKIRTPSRTGSWLIEAMGAVPVGAPVPQVPEMLSRRVVDAVIIPFEIALPLKVHEMVDYHMVLDDPLYPRASTSVFLFAMNRGSYDRLPADLQAVIDGLSGRNIARWAGEIWQDIEKPGEAAARASGEWIAMAPAEVARFRERVEGPVVQRWIGEVREKGIDGAALVEEARALVAKYTESR